MTAAAPRSTATRFISGNWIAVNTAHREAQSICAADEYASDPIQPAAQMTAPRDGRYSPRSSCENEPRAVDRVLPAVHDS